jgi:hypothetical protein
MELVAILVVAILLVAIYAQRAPKRAAQAHYDAAVDGGDASHAARGCVQTCIALGIAALAILALMAVAAGVPPRGM